jgi:DNA-binding response OmpR family regulator
MPEQISRESKWRILLVEDDHDIAALVSLHLSDIGAEIHHVDRGDEALRSASESQWDFLILDLRLPGLGGLEVCRLIREQGNQVPILMLTSKSTELDRVLGLELGADDYLTKPFSPMELTARVKAILRRVDFNDKDKRGNTEQPYQCGPLQIDVRRRSVSLQGSEVELTSREFDLLLYFVRNPGEVFRRSELLDKVWGYGHEGYEHTVNSHINRLRAKIEDDPTSPQRIITVWGVGYKFNEMQAA